MHSPAMLALHVQLESEFPGAVFAKSGQSKYFQNLPESRSHERSVFVRASQQNVKQDVRERRRRERENLGHFSVNLSKTW